MHEQQVVCRAGKLAYRLSFADRKTLTISVLPDGTVEVSAPYDTPLAKIEQRIVARLPWIDRQKAYFAQFMPRSPARQYVGGETHLYLGRQYRLRLEQGEDRNVRLYAGRLVVSVPEPDRPDRVREALETWYAEQARIRLPERVSLAQAQVRHLGLSHSDLTIRTLRRRWGSMSPAGRLTLNRDLIKAPISSIDYVIVHELCHLAHADHGAAFYRLLRQMVPDWEAKKARLERLLA
jgi:predicted metal-dependent hydrolase